MGSKINNRYAAWKTPYIKIDALFLIDSNVSSRKFLDEGNVQTMDEVIAARLAICMNGMKSAMFRAVLDLIPLHDPLAMITYQRTLPNDSEVFQIASCGQVTELIEALKERSACLTDRDEEGRSLLNLSYYETAPCTKANS